MFAFKPTASSTGLHAKEATAILVLLTKHYNGRAAGNCLSTSFAIGAEEEILEPQFEALLDTIGQARSKAIQNHIKWQKKLDENPTHLKLAESFKQRANHVKAQNPEAAQERLDAYYETLELIADNEFDATEAKLRLDNIEADALTMENAFSSLPEPFASSGRKALETFYADHRWNLTPAPSNPSV